MKIKYANLVFKLSPPFPEPEQLFLFEPQIELSVGSLANQIEKQEIKHWAEWLGSLTWEHLTDREKLILTVWDKAANPGVLDKENEILRGKVHNVLRVLPLVFPIPPPLDDSYLFSGCGELQGGSVKLGNIRSFGQWDSWKRSYYMDEHKNPYFDWAEKKIGSATDFLGAWKTCYKKFQNLLGMQKKRQFIEAFRSFEEGMEVDQLEFKMPNLVRSIECVTAPRGAKAFAERAMFFSRGIESDLPYGVSMGTRDLLEELYQLRNDCSHGKPFGYSYMKRTGNWPDGLTVAKYEFLAEWMARRILLYAFDNQSFVAVADDFDTLENAWNKGKVTQ